MRYILILILCIFLYIFLSALIQSKKNNYNQINPVNLTKQHVCSNDSMIIINYNGPKAQIIWKDNSISFYCEVREIFYEINNNVKKKIIKKIFVQDFSNVEWGSYIDKWIEATDAYYVVDSIKDGAMGVTYVPFSSISCANTFISKYGGKLLTFNQIDNKILALSNNILKERLNF